ncbi:MAG: hypothetical protein N2171_06160 [Clostridia bacterium]|nr:hypothetical protein [Clostridia bacterium]
MEIVFSNDKYKMNWLRDDFEYAQVLCGKELDCEVSSERDADLIKTRIMFTNRTEKPIFTSIDSIGIRFPLNDKYEGSDVCITNRCHTHIFCGGDVSYVMALRMGGEAPHLGMVVTEVFYIRKLR